MWIHVTTQEYNEACGCDHYSGLSQFSCITCYKITLVLVSHNGYRFDFPILLAEIERRPEKLALTQLVTHNIHFSDTLGHLKTVNLLYEVDKLNAIYK